MRWTYFSWVCKTFLPAYSNAKIIKIEHVFPELWCQTYCHVFFCPQCIMPNAKCSKVEGWKWTFVLYVFVIIHLEWKVTLTVDTLRAGHRRWWSRVCIVVGVHATSRAVRAITCDCSCPAIDVSFLRKAPRSLHVLLKNNRAISQRRRAGSIVVTHAEWVGGSVAPGCLTVYLSVI